MALVLFHHPHSRAANVVWMLEEIEIPYQLHYVDMMAGAHKNPDVTSLNPMGKLPILQDDQTIVTESAAIGLYLADRYASGKLAPALDDPNRGTYLRWSLFAPSVIEPGAMAKSAGWTYREGAAGFGNYDAMISAIQSAILGRKFLLGERFSMADAIFGGTLRYMVQFKMIEPLPEFTRYIEQLNLRPAQQRASAINARITEERGLKRS